MPLRYPDFGFAGAWRSVGSLASGGSMVASEIPILDLGDYLSRKPGAAA